MNRYGVFVVIIVCVCFSTGVEGQLLPPGSCESLENGYNTYYQCVLQCYQNVFQFISIGGDLCDATIQLRVTETCITKNCRAVVPSLVCVASPTQTGSSSQTGPRAIGIAIKSEPDSENYPDDCEGYDDPENELLGAPAPTFPSDSTASEQSSTTGSDISSVSTSSLTTSATTVSSSQAEPKAIGTAIKQEEPEFANYPDDCEDYDDLGNELLGAPDPTLSSDDTTSEQSSTTGSDISSASTSSLTTPVTAVSSSQAEPKAIGTAIREEEPEFSNYPDDCEDYDDLGNELLGAPAPTLSSDDTTLEQSSTTGSDISSASTSSLPTPVTAVSSSEAEPKAIGTAIREEEPEFSNYPDDCEDYDDLGNELLGAPAPTFSSDYTTLEQSSTTGSGISLASTGSLTIFSTTDPGTTSAATVSGTPSATTDDETTTASTDSGTNPNITSSETTQVATSSETTSDTTDSGIASDTTDSGTASDTTDLGTTTDTTDSGTTSDTTDSETASDTTDSGAISDTTDSETSSDTTDSGATSDTTDSGTTSDMTDSDTTSATTDSGTSATTESGTTSASKASNDSSTTSETTESVTTSATTTSATTLDSISVKTTNGAPTSSGTTSATSPSLDTSITASSPSTASENDYDSYYYSDDDYYYDDYNDTSSYYSESNSNSASEYSESYEYSENSQHSFSNSEKSDSSTSVNSTNIVSSPVEISGFSDATSVVKVSQTNYNPPIAAAPKKYFDFLNQFKNRGSVPNSILNGIGQKAVSSVDVISTSNDGGFNRFQPVGVNEETISESGVSQFMNNPDPLYSAVEVSNGKPSNTNQNTYLATSGITGQKSNSGFSSQFSFNNPLLNALSSLQNIRWADKSPIQSQAIIPNLVIPLHQKVNGQNLDQFSNFASQSQTYNQNPTIQQYKSVDNGGSISSAVAVSNQNTGAYVDSSPNLGQITNVPSQGQGVNQNSAFQQYRSSNGGAVILNSQNGGSFRVDVQNPGQVSNGSVQNQGFNTYPAYQQYQNPNDGGGIVTNGQNVGNTFGRIWQNSGQVAYAPPQIQGIYQNSAPQQYRNFDNGFPFNSRSYTGNLPVYNSDPNGGFAQGVSNINSNGFSYTGNGGESTGNIESVNSYGGGGSFSRAGAPGSGHLFRGGNLNIPDQTSDLARGNDASPIKIQIDDDSIVITGSKIDFLEGGKLVKEMDMPFPDLKI